MPATNSQQDILIQHPSYHQNIPKLVYHFQVKSQRNELNCQQ